jgi:DNA-binding response OmpR family regulator
MNRSTNVLLIEDDPNLGPATLELLAAQGHAALLADSYEQAFAILTGTHRIEVLILDLQLGLRRGDELVASLRTHGARVPPIVVFSAKPIDELAGAARRMGAEAYLQKPCSAARIGEAIDLARANSTRQPV